MTDSTPRAQPTPLYSPQIPSPPAFASPIKNSRAGSRGASITLLVFSILGLVSPFLPFLSDDYGDSISGWDSVEGLEEFGEFSSGPMLILITSIFTAIIGIVVIININSRKGTNRIAVGVTTLLAGLVSLFAGGSTYNALDNFLLYLGVTASQGLGLSLAILTGLASTVIGIIFITHAQSTQSES